MNTQNFLIIDDHPMFRDGMKNSILSLSSQYKITGEAEGFHEGLKIAKKKKPDIIVIDITLQDGDGIYLTKKILETTRPKIIIISGHSKLSYVIRSIQAGASAYIKKDSCTKKTIEKCLQTILQKNKRFIDNELSEQWCEYAQNLGVPASKEMALATTYNTELSCREKEIFRLCAEERNNSQIAEMLGISALTVRNHRINAMKKLGLADQSDILKFAVAMGIIDIDRWTV